MNQNFNLSINKPCSENFNQFKKTEAGGFCNSCQKEVIDFSNMTPNEIKNYFKNKEGQVCGSFKPYQLKNYTETSNNNSKFNFISGLSFSLLTLGLISSTHAQTPKQPTVVIEKNNELSSNTEINQDKEYTISGVITAESYSLPGASVVLQGTMVGTETDFDGKFTFPQKLKKGDVLVISFIGYNSKQVTISDDNKKLNFEMNITLEMDSCMLMGEVEVKKVYKSKRSLWRRLKF